MPIFFQVTRVREKHGSLKSMRLYAYFLNVTVGAVVCLCSDVAIVSPKRPIASVVALADHLCFAPRQNPARFAPRQISKCLLDCGAISTHTHKVCCYIATHFVCTLFITIQDMLTHNISHLYLSQFQNAHTFHVHQQF
jgi:hypothetical protein